MCWHIREAVRRIAAGGIIAYPTESVYGLGCDPFNGAAVSRLLRLKHRSIGQGVILVAADFAQLQPLLFPLDPTVKKRVLRTWPGAVTWLLPCLPEIPIWLRGTQDTLAVRVTSHPVASALCRRWGGPLVSSSANLHGRRPAATPLEIRRAFNNQLDYILRGPAGSGQPSEIRDGRTGHLLRGRKPAGPDA